MTGGNELTHWLRALFHASPMAIGFSRDGTMLDANAPYVTMFGFAGVDDLRGRSLLEQIAPSHRADIIDKIQRRARGEETPSSYLTRGVRRDGHEFPFEVTTCRVVVPDGPLTIAFIRDVSDRERTQVELTAALEMFRTLAEAALEGVTFHEQGRILLMNDAGARMLGYRPEELIGTSVVDLCMPEFREASMASFRTAARPFEVVARHRDGHGVPIEIHPRELVHQGGGTRRIAVVRDLTERKQAEAARAAFEERVRRSEQLESLGALAGGVAHDFNNLLTIITSEATLARRAGASGAIADALRSIEHATDRAAELCRQMLAYGGRATIDRQRVELSALVRGTAEVLDAAMTKRAVLVHTLAPELDELVGDPTQLRQVLLNLVLNACEAVTSSTAEIRVTTGATTLEAPLTAGLAGAGELPAGRYVWLEVADPGAGMDAATVARMFDPFFTTKFMGRGLGMASVLGIVRGHGGAIQVESAPGAGTRVRVLLPVAPRTAAATFPDVTPPRGSQARGIVLVVDDEPAIRNATERLLDGYGFDVLLAPDGAAAVAAFTANADHIRAIVMDISMPVMDGVTAAAEIRRLAPRIPIILVTGHAAARPDALEASGANELLEKPYASNRLVELLRRLTR